MAGARVAQTFELLEQILLNLSSDNHGQRTVVSSQRVAAAFNDTIANSTRLQTALFLATPTTQDAKSDKPRHWLNDMLCDTKHLTFDYRVRSHSETPTCFQVHLHLPKKCACDDVCTCALNPQASWRKMHLSRTEYTVFSLGWGVEGSICNKWGQERKDVLNPTLGELFDASPPEDEEADGNDEEEAYALRLRYGFW